jgi:tight adherence protein B
MAESLFGLMLIVGSMLLAYGVYEAVNDLRKGQRRKMVERLKSGSSTKKEMQASILRRSVIDEANKRGLEKIFSGLAVVPKLQGLLDQANVEWSASRMLMNLSGIAVAVPMLLMLFGIGILGALGVGIATFFMPLIWLSMRRKRRMKKLVYQLPDVFEQMSQALRAGHSLASAIQLIGEQMPDPIGTEFGRVFHEQNLGVKVEDALKSMADRVDQLDVRFFVTAVLIQRQTGGDLAEVLDKIGSVIRERIELFGLVQALTAEGRLSGWVLFALPFLVFGASLKLNPEYASMLLNESMGQLLLCIAIGMQLMGIAMIRWIVNIKV